MSEADKEIVNQDKLINILKSNEVRISTKGNICLSDFISNIIGSKNPIQYAKRLKCDLLLNEHKNKIIKVISGYK